MISFSKKAKTLLLVLFTIILIVCFSACNSIQGIVSADSTLESSNQNVVPTDSTLESSNQDVVPTDSTLESSNQDAVPVDPTKTVQAVSIANASLLLPLNESVQIEIQVYPTDAVYTEVTYTIDEKNNSCGATITDDGVISCTQLGSVNICVTIDNISSTYITFNTFAEIYTAEDLAAIKKHGAGHYILCNDIDLGGMEWTPIYFAGVFDGKGHVISNFKVSSSVPYAGLFGVNMGTIRNLRVENFTIDDVLSDYGPDVNAGGLAGYNAGGTITNCYASGDVKAIASSSSRSPSYAGSLVGYNDGTITNSFATGKASAGSDNYSGYAGSLVGYNNGAITNSYATGYSGSDAYAGGLVGANGGAITNSYATGNVYTGSGLSSCYAGGLAGYNTYGNITNCYATGDVEANSDSNSYAGGLVGYNDKSTIINCYATGFVYSTSEYQSNYKNCYSHSGGLVGANNGTIANCYATGNVNATCRYDENYKIFSYTYAGGLVGSQGGIITNCYSYSEQSITVKEDGKVTHEATNTEGTAKTMEELLSQEWVAENLWSVETQIWDFSSGYPTLNYDALDATVEISTKEELCELQGQGLTLKYVLINNIDLDGMEWTPIATFAGIFDGNGYAISNFKVTGSVQYAGLFGRNIGTIQNLGVKNFTIDVSSSDKINYAGGLVAYNISGTITNCYTTGDVNSESINSDSIILDNYVGGLTGYNIYGTITNCYATGDISSNTYHSNAGGLVGYSTHGTITNCYATGNISSNNASLSYAGGLVGYNDNVITNCYATGDISSNTYTSDAGGLVGYSTHGTITNCYATGDISYDSNYSYIGGLVGYNNENTITNCYRYSGQSVTVTENETTTHEEANTVGTAKTMEELLVVAFHTNTLGWDAVVWNFVEGQYPTLKNVGITD